MKPGDRVAYNEISIYKYQGVIVSIGPTKNGGDCLVKWDMSGITSEEITKNLILVKAGSEVSR